METRVVSDRTEHRIKMTLFVQIGSADLKRKFQSKWCDDKSELPDANDMHRTVEQQFRELCDEWGVTEANGLIVSEDEIRTIRVVEETDYATVERIRNMVKYLPRDPSAD